MSLTVQNIAFAALDPRLNCRAKRERRAFLLSTRRADSVTVTPPLAHRFMHSLRVRIAKSPIDNWVMRLVRKSVGIRNPYQRARLAGTFE